MNAEFELWMVRGLCFSFPPWNVPAKVKENIDETRIGFIMNFTLKQVRHKQLQRLYSSHSKEDLLVDY